MDLTAAREAIATAVNALPDRPVLVCVDGHSAAGKSTAAAALASEFGAALVPGDDFYRVMNEVARERLTPAEGADRYYDWQRMDLEVLSPLAAGRPAVYHPYDWSTGELSSETNRIDPSNVVIIEGLFVSRLELRHRYSVMILVTTDSSRRQERQRARADATDDWLDRWDAAERHHLNVGSPPADFDAVIDGSR